jgi:tetratricopeptide (TPR) repeat protein
MVVYKQYVNLLIRSNKIQKGIDILNQLEKKIGISEETSMQKRDLYLMQGKMEKSIYEIKNLSDAFLSKVRFLFVLAESYNSNSQSEKAFQIYKKILKLDPKSPYIHISLSDYYRKKEMPDSSYHHLQKGFKNTDLGIDDKVQILILLLTEKREYLQQKKLAEIITKTHPKEAKGFTILGDIEYQENNLFNAEKAYREAVRLDPNRYPIWEQLLIIDTELQKNYATIEDAKLTIELFPEQALPYLILGGAYYLQKDYKNVVKVLEEGKSWTLNRVDLTIQLNAYLGDAYNELKEYKKSSTAYETVLLLDPDNIYVLNNYAYYLSLRKEKLQRAKEMGKHAIELKPSTSTYLDTYAWILYQLMEYSEAETFMQKALLNGGRSSAIIVEHYGDILWKIGEKDKAIDEWKNADAIGKGSPFLNQKISLNKMVE